MTTTPGFRKQWRTAKRRYRNAVGGTRLAARRRLVRLVADELRAEVKRA
jgi:hypothetical protein